MTISTSVNAAAVAATAAAISNDNSQSSSMTGARTDKENDETTTRNLTESALKELSMSKTSLRPRSDTVETEINSDTTTATASPMTTTTTATNNRTLAADRCLTVAPTWDSFVRQGTRLKTLLGDAMVNVRTHQQQGTGTAATNNKRSLEDDGEYTESDDLELPPARRPRLEARDAMAGMLQEKSTEILRLQRLLKESHAESVALQATNTSLREEVSSTQTRLDRSTVAMRLSSDQAAKSRADADAAEATAASLAQTLQSLQSVVDETKKATYLLSQEQQQLAEASSAVEAKLLQKEADLARAHSALRTLRNEKATFDLQAAKWTYEKSDLQRRYETSSQELEELRKAVSERDAVESARKQRAHKVEEELRHVQAHLKEATSGQEESAKTQASMQETIVELQKANKELHSKLTLQQDAARKEVARLNEALTKAEKEAQGLRIQGEAYEEDFERLRLDKVAIDKQNSQLKSQIARLDMQLKEGVAPTAASSSSVGLPSPPTNTETPRRSSTGFSFSLPPLGGSAASERSNGVASHAAAVCCICFKASFGMMNRCQCGKPDCNKRAHMTCANRIQPGISVSHPGTPAPQLPLVLCGSVTTSALKATSEKDD